MPAPSTAPRQLTSPLSFHGMDAFHPVSFFSIPDSRSSLASQLGYPSTSKWKSQQIDALQAMHTAGRLAVREITAAAVRETTGRWLTGWDIPSIPSWSSPYRSPDRQSIQSTNTATRQEASTRRVLTCHPANSDSSKAGQQTLMSSQHQHRQKEVIKLMRPSSTILSGALISRGQSRFKFALLSPH